MTSCKTKESCSCSISDRVQKHSVIGTLWFLPPTLMGERSLISFVLWFLDEQCNCGLNVRRTIVLHTEGGITYKGMLSTDF